MKNIDAFKIFGTTIGTENIQQLDEITIFANAETLKKIASFLARAAREMDAEGLHHVHLQDSFENFSHEKHVDIIAHGDGAIKHG